MDCYTYVIQTWKNALKENDIGCIMTFINEIFDTTRCYSIWDLQAMKGIIHLISLQDTDAISEVARFKPIGWTSDDNDKIIDLLMEMRAKHMPLYQAYLELWHHITGGQHFSNYLSALDFDFTGEARWYFSQYKLGGDTNIPQARLPDDQFRE